MKWKSSVGPKQQEWKSTRVVNWTHWTHTAVWPTLNIKSFRNKHLTCETLTVRRRNTDQSANRVLARSSKFIKTEIQKNQAININTLTDSDVRLRKSLQFDFYLIFCMYLLVTYYEHCFLRHSEHDHCSHMVTLKSYL